MKQIIQNMRTGRMDIAEVPAPALRGPGALVRTRCSLISAGTERMNIDLAKVPTDGIWRNDTILFSESQSRFVVTVSPENQRQFEQIIEGRIFAAIGRVTDDEKFLVKGLNKEIIIEANTRELKDAWQRTLRW